MDVHVFKAHTLNLAFIELYFSNCKVTTSCEKSMLGPNTMDI